MKLLFFGDSITDANRNKNVADSHHSAYGTGYVIQISGKLLLHDPQKYEILNRGISGNNILDLYARIKADVWNNHPDVLTILIGVNDVWHEFEWNNGVELDRFVRIYRSIIEETREKFPATKIILMEPFLLNGSATQKNHAEFFSNLRRYANSVQDLAKEYGLPFVPLQQVLDRASFNSSIELYLADGVHPTVAGSALIANEWLKVFLSL